MSSRTSAAPFLPLFFSSSLMPLICPILHDFLRSIDLSTQRKKCNVAPFKSSYGYSCLFSFLLSLNPLFGRRLPPPAVPSSLLSSSLSSLLPSTRREGNTYLSDVFPLSLSPSSSYTLLFFVKLLIYSYYRL